LVSDEVILYTAPTSNISFRNMAVADVPNVENPIAGAPTAEYTKEQAVIIVNKKINTFTPSELSKVTRNLITVKYT